MTVLCEWNSLEDLSDLSKRIGEMSLFLCFSTSRFKHTQVNVIDGVITGLLWLPFPPSSLRGEGDASLLGESAGLSSAGSS